MQVRVLEAEEVEDAVIKLAYSIAATRCSSVRRIKALMDMPDCLASVATQLCVSGVMRMLREPE